MITIGLEDAAGVLAFNRLTCIAREPSLPRATIESLISAGLKHS